MTHSCTQYVPHFDFTIHSSFRSIHLSPDSVTQELRTSFSLSFSWMAHKTKTARSHRRPIKTYTIAAAKWNCSLLAQVKPATNRWRLVLATERNGHLESSRTRHETYWKLLICKSNWLILMSCWFDACYRRFCPTAFDKQSRKKKTSVYSSKRLDKYAGNTIAQRFLLQPTTTRQRKRDVKSVFLLSLIHVIKITILIIADCLTATSERFYYFGLWRQSHWIWPNKKYVSTTREHGNAPICIRMKTITSISCHSDNFELKLSDLNSLRSRCRVKFYMTRMLRQLTNRDSPH